MSLVENIKSLCSEIGISIPKLEVTLGLSRGSVYNWDKNSPSIDKLERVANYLKVSVDFLLDRGNIFDLGPYIEEERLEQGLSAEEFSALIGIDVTELSKYEEQEIPITENLVDKMMNIFGLTFPEFLDKYGLFDMEIPSHFKGDANAYLAFNDAKERDSSETYELETIAAHHDGDEFTKEELEEIERFKEFVKMRRKDS